MDKQYSVEFFACFVDTVQKLCRDYLNFEQAVELSGYLCLEIDNSKKERYVLSELVQSSGDVISESYCTKAFKTVRKGPTITVGYRGTENIGPSSRQFRERGARDSSTNMLYQRGQLNNDVQMSSRHAHFVTSRDEISPSAQFSVEGRERTGRNEKSSNSTSAGNLYSRTEASSSGMINVHNSNSRAQKRTATFSEDIPSSKKDKVHTGSSSGLDAHGTSISPHESLKKESIRMPLAVTIKQENDVAFMVIDNPEDEISEDQSHENSERGSAGGTKSFTTGRGNTHGESQETTDKSVHSSQMQIGISAGGCSVSEADDTSQEHEWGWDTGGQQQKPTVSGQYRCAYCRQDFQPQDLVQQEPYGDLCFKCSGALGITLDGTRTSDCSTINCIKCSQTFSQWSVLCQHMKSVHDEEFKIDSKIDLDKLCENVCSSYTKEAQWKQSQASRVAVPKNYSCDMCDKSYTCNSMLLDHVNSKHANRSYQCVCGAVFSWRSGLERHKKRCTLILQKDLSANQDLLQGSNQ